MIKNQQDIKTQRASPMLVANIIQNFKERNKKKRKCQRIEENATSNKEGRGHLIEDVRIKK
jgi:hypothetical protein